MTSSPSPPKDTTYLERLGTLIPAAKELLNEYIKLPEHEHQAHVLKVVSCSLFT